MAGKDARAALWYYRHHQVYVDLCYSERDAAESAAWMLADGGAAPAGVQLSDGRFVKLDDWQEFKRVCEEQIRAEEEATPQRTEPPPTRQVQVPWDHEQRTVKIPADLPEWVGRKADA